MGATRGVVTPKSTRAARAYTLLHEFYENFCDESPADVLALAVKNSYDRRVRRKPLLDWDGYEDNIGRALEEDR